MKLNLIKINCGKWVEYEIVKKGNISYCGREIVETKMNSPNKNIEIEFEKLILDDWFDIKYILIKNTDYWYNGKDNKVCHECYMNYIKENGLYDPNIDYYHSQEYYDEGE